MPTREVLDVDSVHPVLFDASYTFVVNSAGLKRCGITRDTPNPPRGEIVKDRSGEPNGILKNAPQLIKGRQETAGFSDSEKLTALEQMLRRYLEAGLTAVSDRAVDSEQIALYSQSCAPQNRLPVRAVLTWRPDSSASGRRAREADSRRRFSHRLWRRMAQVRRVQKMTLDGGMTIGTAYQRVPYGEFGAGSSTMADTSSRRSRPFVRHAGEGALGLQRGAREGLAAHGALPGWRRGG